MAFKRFTINKKDKMYIFKGEEVGFCLNIKIKMTKQINQNWNLKNLLNFFQKNI